MIKKILIALCIIAVIAGYMFYNQSLFSVRGKGDLVLTQVSPNGEFEASLYRISNGESDQVRVAVDSVDGSRYKDWVVYFDCPDDGATGTAFDLSTVAVRWISDSEIEISHNISTRTVNIMDSATYYNCKKK